MSSDVAAAPSGPAGQGLPASVDLSAIVERIRPLAVSGLAEGVRIRRVVYDHREVRPADDSGSGDLFFCIRGRNQDGHRFAAAAVAAGASAVVAEHALDLGTEVPLLVAGEGCARSAMAGAACVLNGDPARRLRTVGVTGTNGKTTTTWLVKSVLERHGWPTAVIGTLGGTRTTPEAPELQQALRHAADAGKRAVSLEVTSHALDQHRADGYRHDVAVFTNLTQDHLDYHATMEAYFQAKARLFDSEHAKAGVVNADDEHGRRLLGQAVEVPLSPFSLSDAEALETGLERSTFRLRGFDVNLHLAGQPNVMNALAAAAAARSLGVPDEVIAAGLSTAGRVEGRFEKVDNALGVTVLVDYAHTPAGLEAALGVVRQGVKGGRVILVFGAGGDRDREKRPLMGARASALADVVVVTSDNPRHEDPLAIIEELVSGCNGGAELMVRPDRRDAIASALTMAGPEDVILVAGKGHEKTQQVGDEFVPFDDRFVVQELAAAIAGLE